METFIMHTALFTIVISCIIVALASPMDPVPSYPQFPEPSQNATLEPPPLPAATQGPVDCSLNAETGPCKAAFESYFYNSTARECQYFLYGGCEGNSNRFETKEDCQGHCQSAANNV